MNRKHLRRLRKHLRRLRLYTTPLFDSELEDVSYIPSTKYVHYTTIQLNKELEKLVKFRASPEEIKDLICTLRSRLYDPKVHSKNTFFKAKKYLQTLDKYVC